MVGADDTAAPSFDVPHREAVSDAEIVAANLLAAKAIYYAAMLEELPLFQVMDKLVELFTEGMLPVGGGKGGDLLSQYWKKSSGRFTEVERRNLYARIFGFPGGEEIESGRNHQFNDLWLRFILAVASFSRQLNLDDTVRSTTARSVTREEVAKAGRDLATNLSRHGSGTAHFAAGLLQEQIRDIIDVLGDPDVRGSYRASDMWQVVDRVAALELGGARDSVRYRTMAESGATIIGWLAVNAALLPRAGGLPPSDGTTQFQPGRPHRRTVDLSSRDLVDACEKWLAVANTS